MPAGRPTRLFSLLEAAMDGARVESFGARAGALSEAQRRGLPIAPTWLVPGSAFRDAVTLRLPPGHDPATLLRSLHKPSGTERAARARERLLGLGLPEDLSNELEALVKEHAGAEFTLKPSPTFGDDTIARGAGLDVTLWGARDAAALADGIRRIWALAVEERTLSFLRACKLRDVAMAVVIQRVEPLRARGFVVVHGGVSARDPIPAAPEAEDAHLVAASLGIGAPVVEGASPRDYFRIGIDGGVLARRLSVKSEALVVEAGGIATEGVEASARRAPALPDTALIEAADLAKKVDIGARREIELVHARAGSLQVLDVRQRLGGGFPAGGNATSVWSRTGLADLLPGVPTPLTASLVEDFVESSLRKALGGLGAELPRGSSLVARVHGRYYLNVSSLVPALSGIPGIEPSVVIDLLRGGNPAQIARALELPRRKSSLLALSGATARLFLQERRLEDALTRFERDAEQHRRWLAEMDLAILPDDSLATTLRESRGFLITTGELLLQSSIAALAGHLALQAALSRIVPEGASRVAQGVVAGVTRLESARPAVALAHVVEILRGDEAARAAVLAGAESPSALPAGPGRRALESWLEAFGDRGACELEAEEPRWSEAPRGVMRLLVAGLAAPAADPEQRLSHVRVSADRELAALESQASGVELALVRGLLGRARALARLRERMRVWMARTIAMTRSVTLDVDRRLRRLDPGLAENAVFYLSYAELLSATGRTRADLGALVRMRRSAHAADLAEPDPPDTFVGVAPRVMAPRFDSRELPGVPASSGVAVGNVRVLRSSGQGAEAVAPGDVIVVRTPDVGLTPLFFWAGAVVADSGSQVSHLAVLARELGVPAVLGTLDASTSLADGERVRVDGDRGVVERLDA